MTSDPKATPPRGVAADDQYKSVPGDVYKGEVINDLPAINAVFPDSTSRKTDACEACRSTGLAILPVRYTVVPVTCSAANVTPLSTARLGSNDLVEGGYKYALRTARKGMLYVYYEQSGPYGGNYWEAYAVAENGTLWPQASAAAARAIDGGGLPTCTRSGHNHLRKEFITIQRPETCGTVWLAYSQHTWTPATLERYARDGALRAERMQPIQPAKWIQTAEEAGDHAPIGDASVFQSVMEYQDRGSSGGDPGELPHFGKPQPLSSADGTFKEGVLSVHATRYPWSLRGARSGTGKKDPWEERYQLMCAMSSNGRKGNDRKVYTPMLLGLWDAIGIAHELNGYCHDVIGGIERYKEERAFEINAVDHIEQISTLLQLNAVVLADNYEKTSRAIMDGTDEATNREYARLGMINGSRATEEQKTKLAEHVATVLLPAYQKQAKEQWEEKYWPLIDEPLFKSFKKNMEAFVEKAFEHLRPRTRSLHAWLGSELFLATLEDYDGASPTCGVQFEEVVTDAIEGIAISVEGRAFLSELASNLKPTERNCLLWRVVAQNQDDARTELEQVLSHASTVKETLLTTAGVGWAAFAKGSAYLKSFLGYYKKFEAVQKQVVPSTAANRVLRDSGVDRFVTTAGAVMLNSFPLNGIQDKAGNALVRFVFYTRALMSAEEASDLITKEASSGVEAKRYFLDRVTHHRLKRSTAGSPMMYALRDVERHQGTALMRDCWKRASESSRNAVRLTSLTGILEIVNFANLANKADKQAKDYASLLASGMALVAVYTSVHEVVSKELFGNASRTVGRMKVVGGFLGGGGSFIGAYYDLGDFVTSARDERYSQSVALFTKAMAGASVGGAQFLTALAYSAPLVQRLTGNNALTISLYGLRAGLSAAAAREGEALLASHAMKRVGVWVLRLGGWEVALVIAAIQGLIWALSPNELEIWCKKNAFGKGQIPGLFGFGSGGGKFNNVDKQEESFIAAMGRVTAKVNHEN
ncbi:hypothetical protein ABIA71_000651 [Stenotrophomonas sp. 2619]|uniref:T6SS effector BTH_I2691 family protein n=1 Tax=Stenotrophomonas sp. 2619 TaxID=3156316 RepID=UPI00339B8D9E